MTVAWAVVVVGAAAAGAQDLTPRAYWPAPKGTKVAVVGTSHVQGDVLFDPSIPLYGVDSNIRTGILAYFQTFSLGGRTANVVVELPYSWGTTKGAVGDTPSRRDFAGFNDFGATLSVNLLGAPTMTPTDFQALRADPHPILGASLKILAPTGQYNPNRLINVGANRWAAKIELGSIIPLWRKWLLELAAGGWFFTDDDDFLPGRREQEPIYAFQAHLVRRFKPGFWMSLDANYFTGGRQTIGGNELVDVQHNSRFGAMVAVPFKGRHAVKIGYFVGVRTAFGNDFDQFLVSYQVLFR
ncbi:MAG: transporter [Candidatus Sulfomarinibacteraceae bacterium]